MKISEPIVSGDGDLVIRCQFVTDINLDGASGEFNLSNKSYGNLITKAATIEIDEDINYISATLTKEETTDLRGSYLFDFTITDAVGNVVTVRDNGYPGSVTFTKNLRSE